MYVVIYSGKLDRPGPDLPMMATGLVPRRGQETGGEIRCFLSWFSSLSELGSAQQVPETKQVQWELALANLMPGDWVQIQMMILSIISLIIQPPANKED